MCIAKCDGKELDSCAASDHSGEKALQRLSIALWRSSVVLGLQLFTPRSRSCHRLSSRREFLAILDLVARIPRISVGIYNPAAVIAIYPTLLDHPAPELRVYPRETVIAEKFQAMVHLGTFNSRMKDFYDIWLLSREFDFEGPTMQLAIKMTFENRKTAIEALPVALTSDFYEADRTVKQWMAFVTRNQLADAPATLAVAVDQLQKFLIPIAEALSA